MSTLFQQLPEITVTALNSARRPVALIRLGACSDIIIDGCVSSKADPYWIVFTAAQLPKGYDVNWLKTQAGVFAEVLAGFVEDPKNPQASELTSRICGPVDKIELKPRYGLLRVTFKGTDTARLHS